MGPISPNEELIKKVFHPNGYVQPQDFELMQLVEEDDPDLITTLQYRLKTAEVNTIAQRENKIKVIPQGPPGGATNSTTGSYDDSSAQAL